MVNEITNITERDIDEETKSVIKQQELQGLTDELGNTIWSYRVELI